MNIIQWMRFILKVRNFTVEPVPRSAIQSFIEKWHYSHSTNGVQHTQCFALFDGMTMIGAMMYAHPSMPATAAKYNPINPEKCLELRRLVCIDDTPTNTESYFIGQTFKWLKKNTDKEVIVSFADQHHGHTGVIYKATNFDYLGETSKGRILMVDGKEMHSRSLNQLDRPYGRELNRRYKAGDKNIFWKNTKPKHIYTYYLNKKIKRQIKRL